MTAQIIDGKATALLLRGRVAEIASQLKTPAGLAVLLVGDDPASAVYVKSKEQAAQKAGLRSETIHLPASASEAEIFAVIDRLNADPGTHGILVQLPLPRGIDTNAVLERVNPAKDVDGFHPLNAGLLQDGRARLVPCTPLGCLRLLQSTGVPIRGAQALVIGRSRIVGKPMAALLLAADATVTIAHSATRELPDLCKRADILVSAMGKPGFVKGDWVKPGAVVIDVGISRLKDGSLTGDIEFAGASARAGWITPVPGGVGPMTIACLLRNTAIAAALQGGNPQLADRLLAL